METPNAANSGTPKAAFHAMPPTDTSATQRPRLPPRASSERMRSTTTAPFRATGSVRTFVRLVSMQEETAASRTGRSGSGPPAMSPLVRAMSTMFQLNVEKPLEETFRCHICFENVGVSEAVTLSTCGHKYCEACFKSYLELKVTEGNVRPVCFHPIEDSDKKESAIKTCGVAVSEDQIKAIVDPEIVKKYEYFRFNQEHQHARECPYCSHSQDCAGPESPICVCEQCSKTFCFFHGNAHEDGTCADYELKTAKEEVLNRATIDEISKPCPGCRRDVEKNGGCNHMKCVGCNTSFCWLCGEIIEDAPIPSHYAPGAEGSCSGKQFDGLDPEPMTWWMWVLAILLSIPTVPVGIVFAIVFTPFVWLFNRKKRYCAVFNLIQESVTLTLVGLIVCVLSPVGWILHCFMEMFYVAYMVCCTREGMDTGSFDSNDPYETNDLEAGLVKNDDDDEPVDEDKVDNTNGDKVKANSSKQQLKTA